MTAAGETDAARLPGSNVKGRAAGAAWTYLLDSLAVETAVCIGQPSDASLATLQRLAQKVVVVGRSSGRGSSPSSADGLLDGSAQLVYVVELKNDVFDVVVRVMSDDAVVYVESNAGSKEQHIATTAKAARLTILRRFWLTPASGEVRAAVPFESEDLRGWAVRNGIVAWTLHRAIRPLERRAAAFVSRRRVGLLLGKTSSRHGPGAGMPTYLRQIAAAGGAPQFMDHRIALSARGQYNSRKVLMYLFPPGRPRPDVIVKTTRHPSFNDRLTNEDIILRRVADESLVAEGTAPRVVFSGEHGGLKFLAETILDGRSLWGGTTTSTAASAYAWLTDLAVRSARRDAVTGGVVRSRVSEVVDGVVETYSLSAGERERLDEAAETVRTHADSIPIVVAHGDAATWNSLVLEDGRIAFMDWEAARLDGIPLWDLWYFARSRHMTATRVRRRLKLTRPRVVEAIHHDAELRRAIAAYREVLDVPAAVVEPLFVLCWADRALREVSRLEPGAVRGGHYIGLVTQLLRERPGDG